MVKPTSSIILAASSLLIAHTAFHHASLAGDVQRHFAYDEHAPLEVRATSVLKRGAATVHDISYASPKGGRVPAYLVIPQEPDAHPQHECAAIVWGHWMMPNSPTANRTEFLDEAVSLAPLGVISLLIDTPQVRPGFKEDPDPLGSQQTDVLAQQVVDLRRGLDLLLSRNDVDAQRIAFVGHSFDSGAGAILDAIDKRFKTFVFMGGPISVRDYVLSADSPDIVAFRKTVSAAKLHAYLDTHVWADPGEYAAHFGPAPALFQYGTHDDYAPVPDAQKFFARSAGSKQMRLYDAGHGLNAQARHDRIQFLKEHLHLAQETPALPAIIPAVR